MNKYQMCHLQILVKHHRKIKKIGKDNKKNFSEVVNDILNNYFDKDKEMKEALVLEKTLSKYKDKVLKSKKKK